MKTLERGGKTYQYLWSEVITLHHGQRWLRHRYCLPNDLHNPARHAFDYEMLPVNEQIIPELPGGFA